MHLENSKYGSKSIQIFYGKKNKNSDKNFVLILIHILDFQDVYFRNMFYFVFFQIVGWKWILNYYSNITNSYISASPNMVSTFFFILWLQPLISSVVELLGRFCCACKWII